MFRNNSFFPPKRKFTSPIRERHTAQTYAGDNKPPKLIRLRHVSHCSFYSFLYEKAILLPIKIKKRRYQFSRRVSLDTEQLPANYPDVGHEEVPALLINIIKTIGILLNSIFLVVGIRRSRKPVTITVFSLKRVIYHNACRFLIFLKR